MSKDLEDKTEEMKVTDMRDEGNGVYTVVTRQGGELLAHKFYTFPPEVGRCLPRFVTEPQIQKRWYQRIIDYFFK